MTVLVTTLMLISIVLLRQTMPPVMALAGITVVGIAGLLVLLPPDATVEASWGSSFGLILPVIAREPDRVKY
jgi:hypothetical protein